MPRESVLAYRFVVTGALPFEPEDLRSFASAQSAICRIRDALYDHGDVTGTVRPTTRAKPRPRPDPAVVMAIKSSDVRFGTEIDTEADTYWQATKVEKPGPDPADIPPSLDRRPKAT